MTVDQALAHPYLATYVSSLADSVGPDDETLHSTTQRMSRSLHHLTQTILISMVGVTFESMYPRSYVTRTDYKDDLTKADLRGG